MKRDIWMLSILIYAVEYIMYWIYYLHEIVIKCTIVIKI
jgi:hypothetical protein